MVPPFWIPAALRSLFWLGYACVIVYSKKPDEGSFLSVRPDAIGLLGGAVALFGLTFHVWSNATLARSERAGAAVSAPVADGPFGYVRNPIYLAGILLWLGVRLLYAPWRISDLALPLLVLACFHVAVVRVEEPELRRRFGSKYEEYCERVPRWLPISMSRAEPPRPGT